MKLIYQISLSTLPRNPTIAAHHDSLIRAHDAPSHMLEDLSPQDSTPHTPRHHPSSFRLISSPHNPPTSHPSLPQCCCRQIHSQKFVPSSTTQKLPIPRLISSPTASLTHIKTYPPPRSVRRAFPNALAEAQNAHISVLDPSGIRTRLFARSNPDAPQPGDILLAIFKSGEPFAGVCLSIRRRGTDTAVLLRNTLMMTGVELWVKIYSPNVRGIEVVQRALKRARRARLFYMRFVVLSFLIFSFNLFPIFL